MIAAPLALSSALLLLAGCPHPPVPDPPAREHVRVRAFTEATAVSHVLAVPPFAFAATSSGLDRWDLRSGQGVHLGADRGLPGEQVQAMAYDHGHNELWIATEAGLVRYDVVESAFLEVPPPPDILAIDSFEHATVETAREGGVWVGLDKGLFRVTRDGEWAPTGITAPVSALLVGPDASLWIGTDQGLFVSRHGVAMPLDADHGCDLSRVSFLAMGPDARAVAVGDDPAGHQRIALASATSCQSYRVSPDKRWTAVASRPGELLVLTGGRLWAMRQPEIGRRLLTRDGMQLMPVPRKGGGRTPPSPFVMRALDTAAPAGAQALAAAGSEVLVGTRSLGTARLMASGGRAVQWLRRGELVDQATTLSVACATRDDCYLATGSRRAWRWNGDRFVPAGGGERRVLAVVRGPGGRVFGLRQSPDRRRIVLGEIKAGEWTDTGTTIATPGRDPEVGFARFSPSGLLWLGLRYRDDSGELRPYGVALVDIPLGVVVYHHASADASEAAKGVLAIPIDVAGVDFLSDDEAWLATTQGAAQVKGEKVVVYSEADGLKSEILHGVACSAGGMVYVAAGQGVGTFDGERWDYPRALELSVNDIEIAPDGRLWMATDRGLAVYDGARVRRLDARRGLVENRIQNVAIDQYGRVWLRGTQSLALVTP